MKIKDNRVDNFCEVIGFTFDESSGLFLPRETEYQLPTDQVEFTQRIDAKTKTPFNSVYANTEPQKDLNLEGIEAMMRKIQTRREEMTKPLLTAFPLGWRWQGNVSQPVEGNIADDLQRWLDDMEED